MLTGDTIAILGKSAAINWPLHWLPHTANTFSNHYIRNQRIPYSFECASPPIWAWRLVWSANQRLNDRNTHAYHMAEDSWDMFGSQDHVDKAPWVRWNVMEFIKKISQMWLGYMTVGAIMSGRMVGVEWGQDRSGVIGGADGFFHKYYAAAWLSLDEWMIQTNNRKYVQLYFSRESWILKFCFKDWGWAEQ